MGAVYSLNDIVNCLELRDGPSLGFHYNGKEGVIQDSHLSAEELLSVPGLGDTTWKYIRETNEWIPVFQYHGEIEDLLATVDLEPYSDTTFPEHADLYWWVTPKGFPREQ